MQQRLIKVLCMSALFTFGCSRSSMSGNSSSAKTDLGTTGNSAVADTFSLYQQKAQHCSPSGQGKRVMVTGFGLGMGLSFNGSGMIVDSFADPLFTPDNLTLVDPSTDDVHQFSGSTLVQGTLGSGTLSSSDHGAKIRQRQLTIDGNQYEFCFLTLDVVWDQSAAIVVQEASNFKPDFVLMTGENGADTAEFEVGAFNQADYIPGYDSQGNKLPDNQAQLNVIKTSDGTSIAPAPILPNGPAQLAFNWDNHDTATAVGGIFSKIPTNWTAPASPISNNIYICDNIGYVVQAAASSATLKMPIVLAGGAISSAAGQGVVALDTSGLSDTTKTGFMHVAQKIHQDIPTATAWINVELAVISFVLNGT